MRISIQRFEQAFCRLSFSNALHYRQALSAKKQIPANSAEISHKPPFRRVAHQRGNSPEQLLTRRAARLPLPFRGQAGISRKGKHAQVGQNGTEQRLNCFVAFKVTWFRKLLAAQRLKQKEGPQNGSLPIHRVDNVTLSASRTADAYEPSSGRTSCAQPYGSRA